MIKAKKCYLNNSESLSLNPKGMDITAQKLYISVYKCTHMLDLSQES